MRTLPVIIFLLAGVGLMQAQVETYDIVSYKAPQGWKKELKEGTYTSFTKVNNAKNTYCQLFVMQSMTSKGSVKADFENDWQTMAVKNYGVTSLPQMGESSEENGWKSMTGSGNFEFNNGTSALILTTVTGFGKTTCILAITNSDEYSTEIDAFFTSVQMKKMNIQSNNIATNTIQTQTASKYTFTTTNFDDGWTVTEQLNWVELKKGNSTVRLHFGIPYTDETRRMGDNDLVTHFWNQLISPRISVAQIDVKNSELSYFKKYYGQGLGTEIASGKKAFVRLLIYSENGYAFCIEVVAPDMQSLNNAFPNEDAIINMRNYNKFAVSALDIIGTWEGSTNSTAEMYNVVTGNYAGMNTVSYAEKFIFNRDLTYRYEFQGASGMVGNIKVSQVKRNGKYQISNWELVTTDSEGKTNKYDIRFELVKGGRILHMQNKQYSGLNYYLVKAK